MDELKEAWDKAYSMESMPKDRAAREIGRIQKGTLIYVFYRDNTGAYWFKNLYQTEQGILTANEKIFGKRRRNTR